MTKLFSLLALLTFLFSCGQTKTEQTVEPASFKKIIFHTSACYGTCPTYHLEVDANKGLKLYAESVFKDAKSYSFKQDSVKMGYFKGEVGPETFERLNQEIKTIGLDSLAFDGVICCDGSVITLIVYYDGKRKFLRSMLPPVKAKQLIATLYDICEKSTLTSSTEKFDIENEKMKK